MDGLLGEGPATWAEMKGRRMSKGWIAVSADAVDDVGPWIDLALEHNAHTTGGAG